MELIDYVAPSPAQAQEWADRAAWLFEHGFGAEPVASADPNTVTLRRPAGHPASDPERHGAIRELAELMGESLRRLHCVDPDELAGPGGWEAVAERVRRSEVDPGGLPDPYRRYDRDHLIELWEQSRPAEEEPVVCHGAARLENFFVANGAATGWIAPTRLTVADRHLDLALAHRSIGTILGNDAIYAFYEAYGADPSLIALEHYLLAELLLP